MSDATKVRKERDHDRQQLPLVAHVIFRLDVGGLENGLVNLINRTPPNTLRHAIICVTCATSFRNRIQSQDVPIVELHKKPGKGLSIYWRFWRAIRNLKPDIVHTRNVNSLEYQFVAAVAGVPVRIHGEHGWDVHDLHGQSAKFRYLRKLMQPFVSQFIVVSNDLRHYLVSSVGVKAKKVLLILNGVDTTKFRHQSDASHSSSPSPQTVVPVVICAIGRMKDVKNHDLLVEAFVKIVDERPERRGHYRLLLIGDGPLKEPLIAKLTRAGVYDLASLPGESSKIEYEMRKASIFVSPSKNEGISNTILEAMATELPVVATKVGGTEELVVEGVTGFLVQSENVTAMAAAICKYLDSSTLRQKHGQAGRQRVVNSFDLNNMVSGYMAVYKRFLN